MSSVCAAQPRRERSKPFLAVARQRAGVDLSAQSGSFSRRSVRHTMLAGCGVSALPRTASYAFSCMLNAAAFLKKRNGFCTSHTMSEAQAELIWKVASEKSASAVVVASRRIKSLQHLPPARMIADFATEGRNKIQRPLTEVNSRIYT